MTDIVNLVFAGAGVDGTAYVGAITEFEKKIGSLEKIKRVAGASSGSIMAMLVALNCTGSQIQELYNQIDFSKIITHNPLSIGWSLAIEKSLYHHEALEAAIKNLLIKTCGNVDITFGELSAKGYKDFQLVATCPCLLDGIMSSQPQFFSAEISPMTRILDAVLASASIPLFFPSLCMKEITPGQWVRDKNGFQFYDGGWMLDFPVQVFDKVKYMRDVISNDDDERDDNDDMYNPQTLGFMVYTNKQVHNIKDHVVQKKVLPSSQYIDTFYALLNGAVNGNQLYLFSQSKDPQRSVLIMNDQIAATEFDITAEQKIILMNSGRKAMAEYAVQFPRDQTPSPSASPTLGNRGTLFSSKANDSPTRGVDEVKPGEGVSLTR
jgi:predicted acylesterase/phospholipase RssA